MTQINTFTNNHELLREGNHSRIIDDGNQIQDDGPPPVDENIY